MIEEEATAQTPDFAAWSSQNLANYAKDAYLHIKKLEAANEQLRKDLKFAMQMARGVYGNT